MELFWYARWKSRPGRRVRQAFVGSSGRCGNVTSHCGDSRKATPASQQSPTQHRCKERHLLSSAFESPKMGAGDRKLGQFFQDLLLVAAAVSPNQNWNPVLHDILCINACILLESPGPPASVLGLLLLHVGAFFLHGEWKEKVFAHGNLMLVHRNCRIISADSPNLSPMLTMAIASPSILSRPPNPHPPRSRSWR